VDQDSKELAEVSSKAVAEGVTTAFLQTILGPLVEVGDLARDQIRYIRWKVQVKMFKRANEFLDENGIPTQQVSMKLLLPLVELSSLEDEDDDEMVDRWAALLANAAAGPNRGATVLPSFPRILAELSPQEAAILDVLYQPPDPDRVPEMYHLYPDDPRFDRANDPMFNTRCFNLERLGLLRAPWENAQIPNTDPPEYEHKVHYLEGAALGLSFVLACTPPH
jgi:hypothetical protein